MTGLDLPISSDPAMSWERVEKMGANAGKKLPQKGKFKSTLVLPVKDSGVP